MTKLKMYDILMEEEVDGKSKFITLGKKNIYLDYGVDERNKLGYIKPRVTYDNDISQLLYNDDKVMRMYFGNVPVTIKDGRIDPDIVNTALNKLVGEFKKNGITKEDISEFKFKIVLFNVNLHYDFDFSNINTKIINSKKLDFNLEKYVTKEVNDLITQQTFSSETLFSGNALKNLFFPTIDLDMEKWYDIEVKKITKIAKRLIKGEVDGIEYDIKINDCYTGIEPDPTSFEETSNHIHPSFKNYLSINLSSKFVKESKEYKKVKEDILRKSEMYNQYIDRIEIT